MRTPDFQRCTMAYTTPMNADKFDVTLIVNDTPTVLELVAGHPALGQPLAQARHDADGKVHIDIFQTALLRDVTGSVHGTDGAETKYLASFTDIPVILPSQVLDAGINVGAWNADMIRWVKHVAQESRSAARIYYAYQDSVEPQPGNASAQDVLDIVIWDFDYSESGKAAESFFADVMVGQDGKHVRHVAELTKSWGAA